MEDGYVIISCNPKIKKLLAVFSFTSVVLMIAAMLLQIFLGNPIILAILCTAIIALLIGCIVCYIIEKNTINILRYVVYVGLWLGNFILAIISM